METDRTHQNKDWLTDNLARVLTGIGTVGVTLAVVTISFYFWYFKDQPISADPEPWGQLGDYLGGVLNPIFSFLALVGLLLTLYVQSRELKLSREALKVSEDELKLTRQEQAKAAEALALQNKAIQRQSFEQTFFAMLRLIREVLENSKIFIGGYGNLQGSEALRVAIEFIFLPDLAKGNHVDYVKGVNAGLVSMLEVDTGGFLTQYARTLVTLLEYLRHSMIDPTDIYPRTLRSQLCRDELRLIYFICLATEWARLKVLVEHYQLLPYLAPEDTLIPNDYYTFFSRSAFQQ
jgi:uncharacterized membrane protein